MRIAVCGSIATDQLMSFPGRFGEQLLPESLHHLSVVFLVEDLQVRRGGVGANISYGMSQLGQRPLLVGAVGRDGRDYINALAAEGVDVSAVRVSESRHTARFVCTTDSDLNQVASFYPGAMAEASSLRLSELGALDLAVISPDDPAAMLAHTAEAVDLGVPVVADPSQQISSLDAQALRALLDGPRLLFTNAYEASLLEHKTGWSAAEVLDRVGTRITTHGKDGVVVARSGESDLHVPVVASSQPVDPTGVGDAFRAGWLAGHSSGLGMQRCVELGTVLATLCLEATGPQGWSLSDPVDRARAGERLAAAHGDAAAREIGALLIRRGESAALDEEVSEG